MNNSTEAPIPAALWTEEDGDVLWWCWDGHRWLPEPPYVGSPFDWGHTVEVRTSDDPNENIQIFVGGWPNYHTHWTRIATPPTPEQ